MDIKLPSEIKRSTRPISDRSYYKANEYRTLSFYCIIGLFKGLLDEVYLSNLLKYVMFLRLLCQDVVTKDDAIDAKAIIIDFVLEYEILFGKDAMSSNVHAHLHLVDQVMHFGPLNMIDCFMFENVFKITRTMFHGTRGYEGQIARNLEIKKLARAALKERLDLKQNDEIQYFIEKNLSRKTFSKIDCLIQPISAKKITELKEKEIIALKSYNKIFSNEFLFLSTVKRAVIKEREYHTFSYDSKFESLNNNTIQYESGFKELSYGIIVNFIEFEEFKFCVVQTLKKIKDHDFLNYLSKECLKHLDKFFIFVNLIDEHTLVEWKYIKNRCILIEYDNEIMVTPCVNLNIKD